MVKQGATMNMDTNADPAEHDCMAMEEELASAADKIEALRADLKEALDMLQAIYDGTYAALDLEEHIVKPRKKWGL